ncbi:MAG: HupE / UreJ protein [Chlorobi bacterium OLB7]|nr:MAG: HupE / UreJ protein [Chlorobi bacterium OLB7]
MSPIPTPFFVNRTALVVMLGVLLPAAAMAHPLHNGSGSVVGGLLHPLVGLDHLIALLAVGIWSAEQQKKQSKWWIPLTFLGMMLAGAVAGMQSGGIGINEHFIVSSVLVFGGIIAMMWRPSLTVGLPVLSIFALAHGVAHGAELPADGSPFGFILGFLLAAAAIMAAGFAAGKYLRQIAESKGVRIAGLAIMLAGCFLLLNSLA